MNASLPLKALCRSRTGRIHEVHVLDLSEAGCLINKRMVKLEDDERVLIKLTTLAYQAARVIWVEDGRAGLEFDNMLHSAVLAHLQQAAGQGPVRLA